MSQLHHRLKLEVAVATTGRLSIHISSQCAIAYRCNPKTMFEMLRRHNIIECSVTVHHVCTCSPIGVGKFSGDPKVPSILEHHRTAQSSTYTQHNGLTDTPRPLRQEACPILQHSRRTRTVRPNAFSTIVSEVRKPPLPHTQRSLASNIHLTPSPAPPATPAPSKSSAPTTPSHNRRGPATRKAGRGKTSSSTSRAHGTGSAWARSPATRRGGY